MELTMLGWVAALGLIYILAAAAARAKENGLSWVVSARDETPAPGHLAGRLLRAQRNFFETFPIFAALVLAAVHGDRTSDLTALATQLYFWARLVYLPLYALGIPYVRSLAFTASFAGLVALLYAVVCG